MANSKAAFCTLLITLIVAGPGVEPRFGRHSQEDQGSEHPDPWLSRVGTAILFSGTG